MHIMITHEKLTINIVTDETARNADADIAEERENWENARGANRTNEKRLIGCNDDDSEILKRNGDSNSTVENYCVVVGHRSNAFWRNSAKTRRRQSAET